MAEPVMASAQLTQLRGYPYTASLSQPAADTILERSKMRIAVGADHAGYDLKAPIVELLTALGHEVVDVGAHSVDPNDDYPDFAIALARAVAAGEAERGVMVCGSGVGASVAANKVRGVRAAVCHDTYSAHQGVEHDKMNVLVMGGRLIGGAVASDMVRAYLGAEFSGDARHVRRTGKVKAIEDRYMTGG